MALIAAAEVRGETKYATTITANGHTMTADEHESAGGTNTGPTPMELLLAALGSCSSITLRMYADRKGWELGTIGVALRLFKEKGGPIQSGPDRPIESGPDRPIQSGPDKPIQSGPDRPIQSGPDKPIESGPDKPIESGPDVVHTRIERDLSFSAPVPPDQLARLLEIVEKTPVTLLVKNGAAVITKAI